MRLIRSGLWALAVAGALAFVPHVAQAQNCGGQPSGNTVCASPSGGGAGFPKFRALVPGDMPSGIPWSLLTGTPTTLQGYGITNARQAFLATTNFYVNGNAVVTNNTTAAGNATLHFAAGSATTNATSAASTNVVHIAGAQPTIYVGATITDSTASVIPPNTTVTAIQTNTTGCPGSCTVTTNVTISASITGGGVGNPDTIKWSQAVFPVGQTITDASTSVIPANTTITGVTFSTTTDVAISANVTGFGVGNGDTIQWTAACGPTGASTCSFGNDNNNGTDPTTPFLTAQKAVTLIVSARDLNNFNAFINLAHGASQNYSFQCTAGPVVGLSGFFVRGDDNARTAVGIVTPANGSAIAVKDLCTVLLQDFALYDASTNNGGNFLTDGTGAPGHIDFGGLTFNYMTTGTFASANYAGSVITVFQGNNQINGGANAAFSASHGGLIDFSSINNAFSVANNLAWGGEFAVSIDGIYSGLVQIGATGTFGNPTGHTGTRFFSSGPVQTGGFDPNSIFLGGTDAVATTILGAIGLQNGSGASAAPNYGTSGQFLASGGGSGAKNTWDSLSAHLVAGAGISLSGTTNVTIASSLSSLTASLGSDVNLNNVSNYFDGPSIAQGSTGTWFVSGNVELTSSTTDVIVCKLWDGTTAISSSLSNPVTGSGNLSVALSGIITSPAGNLRISCKDSSSTNGVMKFNFSGNSKDSTITAIRIN